MTKFAQRLLWRGWFILAAIALVWLSYGFSSVSTLLTPLVSSVCILGLAIAKPLGDEASQERTAHQADNTTPTVSQFAAALPDPVVFFDAGGFVTEANQAAIENFGAVKPGTPLALKFRAPERRELVESVLAGRDALPVDYFERVPVERVFRASGKPVGESGKVFVLVFKDQSETRRIDRMRADFIANASHELRTPLASVAGFVETLRGPAKNDATAREQFLEIMQKQTERMARLLDDLLSLSRLEMKPRLASTSIVDLREVINTVLASHAPLAKDSGVALETDFSDLDARVAGDRDELVQVFENLVENACKYGQSGGRVVVSISPGSSGPQTEIDVTVRDFGPGIPTEHIPRITERFYRVEAETGKQQKGTGLGLAIVKHILTRHNARLTIKSELGQGAAFSVHFPAKAA